MPIDVAATKNLAADLVVTLFPYGGGHTADAATSGNELAGTGYARGAITWGAASGGGVVVGTLTITLPNGAGPWDLKSIGIWSALSGGTFRTGGFNVGDLSMAGPGTVNVTITYNLDP